MQALADARGNRVLARAAAVCMDPDPAKRSKGIGMIDGNDEDICRTSSWPARVLESSVLTYILSGICLILSTFITVHYFN